jgi:transposase-like protein
MSKITKPSRSLAEIKRTFATVEACKTHLAKLRWPDGKVTCPRCGESTRVYALKTRPFHWVCKNPSAACPGIYRFSVLTGTVFENTNVPLPTWFEVLYQMTQSKKGISALQVHRMIDPVRGKKGSYRTAWYMCHRIRAAMQEGGGGLLGGIVEVDETYVGGEARNRHGGNHPSWRRRLKPKVPGTKSSKTPVLGAISRKGNVVAQVADRISAKTLQKFVAETVGDNVSLIATDAHPGYRGLTNLGFPHESVSHQRGEYVKDTVHGVVHTANLDSFWSLLKRSVMGSFHHVSKDYLPLYLNEFAWRHNNRDNPDIFDAVLAGC